MGAQRYYVVETKPRDEHLAHDQLIRQQFQPFVPTYRRQRAGDRDLLVPLFPRYIFIALDLEDVQCRWRSVNGTRGVKRLLGHNPDKPTPLPAGVAECFMAACPLQDVLAQMAGITAGLRVRIKAGAMQGQAGTVASTSDASGVQLLVYLLGKMHVVEVPLDCVEAA